MLDRKSLNIDLSHRCSLECPKCQRQTEWRDRGDKVPGRDITMSEIKKLKSNSKWNNQFQFVTAGQTNHTLNGILLESQGFSSDGKLSIDGNVISTDEQDGTFQLKSNGTGKTIIGDLQFQTNDLFNNSNNNFITNFFYIKSNF